MLVAVFAASVDQAEQLVVLLRCYNFVPLVITNYSAVTFLRLDDQGTCEVKLNGVHIREVSHFVYLDFPCYWGDRRTWNSGSADRVFAEAELDAALFALLASQSKPVANKGLLTHYNGYRPQQSIIANQFCGLGWRMAERTASIRDAPSELPEVHFSSPRDSHVQGYAQILITPQTSITAPVPRTKFPMAFNLDDTIARTMRMLRRMELTNVVVHTEIVENDYRATHVDVCSAHPPQAGVSGEIAVLQSLWQ